MKAAELKSLIRDVPDFPAPGILFRDITPLLADAGGLARAIDALAEEAAAFAPEVLVGIESRGFLFGVPLALRLGVGFAPIRKPGKLPAATGSESYALEYGTDRIEIHLDALAAGQRTLIVVDLLANGGTAAAAARLVRRLGAEPVGALFAIELAGLGGRGKLGQLPVRSLLRYD